MECVKLDAACSRADKLVEDRQYRGYYAYAGGKNAAHNTTLVAPHSTAQITYARPHRGRSTSNAAAAQYVLGRAGNNRSAI